LRIFQKEGLMQKADIVIVGGGFPAIYSAWRLARDGRHVTLLVGSDHLGGSLWSLGWKDYLIDIGMQNFDLRTPLGTEFFSDILGTNLATLQGHDWASTTGRGLTLGFEMPDFSLTDPHLCQIALQEMSELAQAEMRDLPKELGAYFIARFGPTLGRALIRGAEKFVAGPIEGLSAAAMANLGMFARVKLGSDAQMEELKLASPYMDDRLGVTLATRIQAFKGFGINNAFGYPKTGALRAFCQMAQTRLAELGVDIRLNTRPDAVIPAKDGIELQAHGQSIHAQRLFWTMDYAALLRHLGIETDLRAVTHSFGAALHAYEVAADSVLGPDYIHDYAPDRAGFRYSRCGMFSNQISADGRTYVLAEIPCAAAQADDAKSGAMRDQAWSDMRQVGFLSPDAAMLDHTAYVFPYAYAVPKTGWESAYDQARMQLLAQTTRISRIEQGQRGRLAFMAQYDTTLQHELKS
jgi:protoporphyrinogen oxidase